MFKHNLTFEQGCNLQFYPNFALFSTSGGMNLDHHFFQESKLSEEQKKGLHQKWNTFFPRIQVKTKKTSSLKMEPGAQPKIRNVKGANFWAWGRSLQPPKANGIWGYGGEAPSRRRHGGLEAEPPALENFAFFCKNILISELFQLKLMFLKRSIETGSVT